MLLKKFIFPEYNVQCDDELSNIINNIKGQYEVITRDKFTNRDFFQSEKKYVGDIIGCRIDKDAGYDYYSFVLHPAKSGGALVDNTKRNALSMRNEPAVGIRESRLYFGNEFLTDKRNFLSLQVDDPYINLDISICYYIEKLVNNYCLFVRFLYLPGILRYVDIPNSMGEFFPNLYEELMMIKFRDNTEMIPQFIRNIQNNWYWENRNYDNFSRSINLLLGFSDPINKPIGHFNILDDNNNTYTIREVTKAIIAFYDEGGSRKFEFEILVVALFSSSITWEIKRKYYFWYLEIKVNNEVDAELLMENDKMAKTAFISEIKINVGASSNKFKNLVERIDYINRALL